MIPNNIFLLDANSKFRIRNDIYSGNFERWQTVNHVTDKRLSLFLRYGETLTTVNEVSIGTELFGIYSPRILNPVNCSKAKKNDFRI